MHKLTVNNGSSVILSGISRSKFIVWGDSDGIVVTWNREDRFEHEVCPSEAAIVSSEAATVSSEAATVSRWNGCWILLICIIIDVDTV